MDGDAREAGDPVTDQPNPLDILPELRSLLARQPASSGDRDTLERAIAELVALRTTTTAAQTRGTELLEEARLLRAQLAAMKEQVGDVDSQ